MNLPGLMNLKEIGILLVGIYLASTLLIAYKYYNAKGGVFRISRLLVVRYLFRFILLLAILFLSYYSIQIKNTKSEESQASNLTLLGITDNSSNLTWKSLQKSVEEMPFTGNYGLIMYDTSEKLWKQIIPATNYDSFFHLIEQGQKLSSTGQKLIFTENIDEIITEDKYLQFMKKNGKWEVVSFDNKEASFFSNTLFNEWFSSSYVKIYLVFIILIILFFEIIFTAKAIKI